MKLKSFFLSIALSALVFSSISNAHLMVGILYFDPPFFFSLDGGFDIDLMYQLCKGLQEKCTLIPMNLNEMYQQLNMGKIDLAIGGISITPGRQERYLFSLPYMLSKAQFLVLKNSKLNHINQLNKHTKVGVIQGDPPRGLLDDYLNRYKGQFQIQKFKNIDEVLLALKNKQITAAFLHRSSVVYWVQNSSDQFRPLGGIFLIGEGIGIMTSPKNTSLIQRINRLLLQMERDNAYLNLYNVYFADE